MNDILAKMREIISDQPSPEAPPQTAVRGPELYVVNCEAPLAAVATALPPITPSPRTDETIVRKSTISAGMLEEVFASAIREAISPTAQQWVNSHQAELIYALSPMLRQWMDDHLPKLVESVLKEELGRAIGKSLRRST